MKIGGVFPDLLTPLGAADSIEEGLSRTLRRLVALTGARAAALAFRPERERPIVVTSAVKPPAVRDWLVARLERRVTGVHVARMTPPGLRPGAVLSAALGADRKSVVEEESETRGGAVR